MICGFASETNEAISRRNTGKSPYPKFLKVIATEGEKYLRIDPIPVV